MKEIDIYVRGSSDTVVGLCAMLLVYKDKRKVVVKKNIEGSTNRVIAVGIINAIALLKEPCSINLYLTTNLGFKSKKSPNRDLIDKILELIELRGHKFIEIVSNEKQNYLSSIIMNSRDL